MDALRLRSGFLSISYLFPEGPPEAPRPVPRRDTKRLDDRSEVEVMAALIRHGYLISIPYGENHRCDLLADDDVSIARVQVKTGHLLPSGSITIDCYSSHHHRGGPCRSYIGEVEFIAVSCPELDKVYLIPEADLNRAKVHLRVEPTANRQSKNVRWAQAYELL